MSFFPEQGSNGTFQLSLHGQDALAFSVSPEQIVNSGTVQVLVRDPNLVDYEKTTIMTVKVREKGPIPFYSNLLATFYLTTKNWDLESGDSLKYHFPIVS